jgi:hypothetical protein
MKMGYKGRIITSDENIRAKRFASEFMCNWSSTPKPFSLLEGINLLKKQTVSKQCPPPVYLAML